MVWTRGGGWMLGNDAIQICNDFFQANTFAFFETVFFKFHIRIFAICPKSKVCFWCAKIKVLNVNINLKQ